MRWKLVLAFIAVFVAGALGGRMLMTPEPPATLASTDTAVAEIATAKCLPHEIAADICSRCNPELIAYYKEIGDWCAGHNVAESQCELCGFGAVHETPTLCAEHNIAEDQCARCHPELVAHFKSIGDWCAGHDVPESQCELCGFGAIHETPTLCAEHSITEDQCARCHPELVAHFKNIGDWCAGHDVPESQCELCNYGAIHANQTNDYIVSTRAANQQTKPTPYPGIAVSFSTAEPNCPTDGAVIQFASFETVARAGITVRRVMTAPISHPFEAPAEVVFDQTATTYMSSNLPITIREWLVEPGAPVQKGAPLARAESPEMAALQGEYLEAWSDWRVHQRERDRAERLMGRDLIDSASYERAIADAISSEGKQIQKESQLLLAGVADIDVEVLRDHRLVSSSFLLRSPVDGTLLERPADLGAILDPGMRLLTIGSANALWIEANVRERDLKQVHAGLRVAFLPDAGNPEPIPGTVTWVSQFLDPHTRTGTVRMKPDRNTERIRAHEFGRLHINDDPLTNSVVIPKSAVQWEGCCNVVFVQDTPERFYPRKVEVDRANNLNYRVVSGLTAEDNIVTEGSFLLKTELKKSSIGAGCCGVEGTL